MPNPPSNRQTELSFSQFRGLCAELEKLAIHDLPRNLDKSNELFNSLFPVHLHLEQLTPATIKNLNLLSNAERQALVVSIDKLWRAQCQVDTSEYADVKIRTFLIKAFRVATTSQFATAICYSVLETGERSAVLGALKVIEVLVREAAHSSEQSSKLFLGDYARRMLECFKRVSDSPVRDEIARLLLHRNEVAREKMELFADTLSQYSRQNGPHPDAERIAASIWIQPAEHSPEVLRGIALKLIDLGLSSEVRDWEVVSNAISCAAHLCEQHREIISEEIIQDARKLLFVNVPAECRCEALKIVLADSRPGTQSEAYQHAGLDSLVQLIATLGHELGSTFAHEMDRDHQLGTLKVLERLLEIGCAADEFPLMLEGFEHGLSEQFPFETRCQLLRLIALYGSERQVALVQEFFKQPAVLIRLPLSTDPTICQANGETIQAHLASLYEAGCVAFSR